MKDLEKITQLVRELRKFLNKLGDLSVQKGLVLSGITAIMGLTQFAGFREGVSYLLLLPAAIVIWIILIFTGHKTASWDRKSVS